MAAHVFVTGASGFVGQAVVEELLRRDYNVVALVHRRKVDVEDRRLRTIEGSLFHAPALDDGCRGAAAVIHLVGIIMENPKAGVTFERMHYDATVNVVDAATRAGVRRYIHMSALGTRPDAVSNYHKTKYRAEQYVRQSTLDWTIFRPSLIHGPRGEFMQMEAMWARKRAPAPTFFMPFMPYFGGKKAGRLQPVFVGDVARAFVDAIEKPATIGEIYPIAGKQVLTWPELHRTIAQQVVGHRRWVLSMPVPIAKALAITGVAPILGFNYDQVVMSQEDNTTDTTKFVEDFGWEPAAFQNQLKTYAKQL